MYLNANDSQINFLQSANLLKLQSWEFVGDIKISLEIQMMELKDKDILKLYNWTHQYIAIQGLSSH